MIRKGLISTLVLFGLTAGGAQAHTFTATAKCGSATLTWSAFANQSSAGHPQTNTAQWSVSFTPASGATNTNENASDSFAGAGDQLVRTYTPVNGTFLIKSSWTGSETRDGNSNTGTTVTVPVTGCARTTPALTTTAKPASATVGASIADVAHLQGDNPKGTITWALYGPNDNSCTASHFTTTAVTVTGSGDYTSPSLTPGQVGTYHWVATYTSKSGFNNSVGPVGCNDPNEAVTINSPPAPPAPPAPPTPTPPAPTPPAPTPPTPGSGAQPNSGVQGCVAGSASIKRLTSVGPSFKAVVTGKGITAVTFYLDGKRYRTLTTANLKGGAFGVNVTPARQRPGQHTLTAKATATCGAAIAQLAFRTQVRLMPNVTPKFTG